MMKNMLRITVVIKGQHGNKSYPAINVLFNAINKNPLTFPYTLQDESIDPLSAAPGGVGLRV